jgi:hypothetical protein
MLLYLRVINTFSLFARKQDCDLSLTINMERREDSGKREDRKSLFQEYDEWRHKCLQMAQELTIEDQCKNDPAKE